MSVKAIASVFLLATLAAGLCWYCFSVGATEASGSRLTTESVQTAQEVGLERFRVIGLGDEGPVETANTFIVEHPFNFHDLNGDSQPDLVVSKWRDGVWGAELAIHQSKVSPTSVKAEFEFDDPVFLRDKIETGWIPPG